MYNFQLLWGLKHTQQMNDELCGFQLETVLPQEGDISMADVRAACPGKEV